MPYRFLDHTADAGFEAEAASAPELFAAALAAFTDTVTEPSAVREEGEHRIEASAPTLPDLMLEWLGECLFRFETEGLLLARAEVEIAGEEGGYALTARGCGEVYSPARHPLKVLIKGITYHRLAVEERAPGAFYARVIFDI